MPKKVHKYNLFDFPKQLFGDIDFFLGDFLYCHPAAFVDTHGGVDFSGRQRCVGRDRSSTTRQAVSLINKIQINKTILH